MIVQGDSFNRNSYKAYDHSIAGKNSCDTELTNGKTYHHIDTHKKGARD